MVSVAKIWLISTCFMIKGGEWLFPLTSLAIKQVQSGEFAVAYAILGQPPRGCSQSVFKVSFWLFFRLTALRFVAIE